MPKSHRTAAALLASALILAALASAAPGAAGGVQLRLDEDEQALGRADAPLTMVEFTDYQCPYCRRFQAETFPRLKRVWVDTGKLRFIVRDLPLEIHSSAQPAAVAAHCAAEQGKFWPMHAALLAADADLSPEGLRRQARALGLDLHRFASCQVEGKYIAAIGRNAMQARELGFDGTPAFVIGKAQNGVLRGQAVDGALPYEDFDAALRRQLAAD
jgi:protein-disulfide isomerase